MSTNTGNKLQVFSIFLIATSMQNLFKHTEIHYSNYIVTIFFVPSVPLVYIHTFPETSY